MLAWVAVCFVSSALTVVWWPFGLVPAVVVLALALEVLSGGRSGRRRGA